MKPIECDGIKSLAPSHQPHTGTVRCCVCATKYCSASKMAKWMKGIEFIEDFLDVGSAYGGYNNDQEVIGCRLF